MNNEKINKIINLLNSDKLIAIPTDTVYGLIGNPFSRTAVDNLYKIKNRSKSKKLSIFLPDKKLIKNICITDNFIENFINNELGNNTIILKKKDNHYLDLIAHGDEIGIRIPDNDLLINILSVYNNPVFATSVNLSGEKECLNYEELINKFGAKIDYIVKIDNFVSSNSPSKIFKYNYDNIIEKIR